MKKWVYPVAAIAVAGSVWIAGDKACVAQLTVVNASGRPITDVQVHHAGSERVAEPAALAPGASKGYRFSDYPEGSYTIRFTDSDGTRVEDTQGYLSPELAFDDTLTLLPASEAKRLAIRQMPTPCKERFHWRSFFRRLIRNLF
jgi:hypothetical protein